MTTSTAGEAPVPTFRRELHPSPVSVSRRDEIHAAPGFGRYFTDHMVLIDYDEGVGWHDPRVVPYGPFSLDPATMVLHYGQEIFEGLKVFAQVDGSLAAFRPEANAARFNRSADRLAIPRLPEELFLASIRELLAVDGAWVPSGGESSLYIRPFIIATEVGLGVRPSANDTMFSACPTATMPSDLATIATCAVAPPSSSTTARSRVRSYSSRSAGPILRATSTAFSGSSFMPMAEPSPVSTLSSRLARSSRSCSRSLM